PRSCVWTPSLPTPFRSQNGALVRFHGSAQVGYGFVVMPTLWPLRLCRGLGFGRAAGQGGGYPRAVERIELDMADRLFPILPAIEDRKSTRLNSSHVKIS